MHGGVRCAEIGELCQSIFADEVVQSLTWGEGQIMTIEVRPPGQT